MNLGKKLLDETSTLRVSTPEGRVDHLKVDHINGQFVWAGPYRVHYLDDRVHNAPVPTWRTWDGVTLALSES